MRNSGEEALVLKKVLDAEAPIPTASLPRETVAELVLIGLLAEVGGAVEPTPAAVHYAELLEVSKAR